MSQNLEEAIVMILKKLPFDINQDPINVYSAFGGFALIYPCFNNKGFYEDTNN